MLEVPFLILQLKQVMAMYRFTLSGTNSQIIGPSYQKDSSPNEIVLDFCERRFSSWFLLTLFPRFPVLF